MKCIARYTGKMESELKFVITKKKKKKYDKQLKKHTLHKNTISMECQPRPFFFFLSVITGNFWDRWLLYMETDFDFQHVLHERILRFVLKGMAILFWGPKLLHDSTAAMQHSSIAVSLINQAHSSEFFLPSFITHTYTPYLSMHAHTHI